MSGEPFTELGRLPDVRMVVVGDADGRTMVMATRIVRELRTQVRWQDARVVDVGYDRITIPRSPALTAAVLNGDAAVVNIDPDTITTSTLDVQKFSAPGSRHRIEAAYDPQERNWWVSDGR